MAIRGGRARLFASVDTAGLVAFRVGLGGLLVVLVLRYFVHGWIDLQFHVPLHFFPWPGFEWVRPWPRPFMHVHFAALGGLAACIAVGLFTRASAALFCLGFTYVHLIDRTNYLNHYYLISLLTGLLAFLPLGQAGSLDVRLGLVRRLEGFPAWTLGLLRFQVGIVYFFAGVAKLQGDWLLRGQPLRIWLSQEVPWLASGGIALAMSWAGAAFDLSAPFLLLWRRARPACFALLVVFHGVTAILFPIGMFPWVMIVAATVFLPPGWPRRGKVPPLRCPAPAHPLPREVALALYALIQVAVPLRHLWLPGDVHWTEEGFRFSWRVMVIEKAAETRLFVRDRSGQEREVRVEDYLTPVQARFMSTQPDLIRAFARLVRGGESVRVRAEARVSLNGRPARLMMDPEEDLGGGPEVPHVSWTPR